jgi:protein phosphatase
MQIEIPDLCLILLIGASSAGKSTFAKQHFIPSEIVSSDACRRMVADDENDQSASADAFRLVHHIVSMRLRRGRLTVVDATNLWADDRKALLRIARENYVPSIAIAIDVPEEVAQQRGQERPDRDVPPEVIQRHVSQFNQARSRLKTEGFYKVFVLDAPEEVARAEVVRRPSPTDRRHEHGPFDFIGDVHGCAGELEALLEMLGYVKRPAPPLAWQTYPWRYAHPAGRKALFVGDLVDRGPRILDTLQLAFNMVTAGNALTVPGNHDDKLMRWLKGRPVKVAHGLDNTVAEIEALPREIQPEFRRRILEFFEVLPSHYVLAGDKLALAHAGIKARMLGRTAGRVRDFTLYGETSGETDEFGLPVRYNWAAEYQGDTMIVYGHTPVIDAEWENKTINIDTGCVFGGKLTALRYPEMELVAVPARRTYSPPKRPIGSGMVDRPPDSDSSAA